MLHKMKKKAHKWAIGTKWIKKDIKKASRILDQVQLGVSKGGKLINFCMLLLCLNIRWKFYLNDDDLHRFISNDI